MILVNVNVQSTFEPHIEAVSGCLTFCSQDQILKPQQISAAITRTGSTGLAPLTPGSGGRRGRGGSTGGRQAQEKKFCAEPEEAGASPVVFHQPENISAAKSQKPGL